MTARIVALGALAVAFLVGGFAALWIGSAYVLDPGPDSALQEDVEAWNRRWVWLQMLAQAGAPIVGAGIIAGIGALGLVVRTRSAARA